MTRQQRWILAVVAVTIVGSVMLIGIGVLHPVVAIAVAVISVGFGWRYVPGFWRTVGAGALAGIVAGGLILGPGFRLSMRVVAIIDPIRTPEFTAGGTFFIILGVGVIFGGMVAILAAMLRRAAGASGPVTAVMMTVVFMGILLIDPSLRSEFVELGAGPWLNIPMFTGVTFLYGIVTNRLIDRLMRDQVAPVPVEVPR